ncbi:hypothetical protein HYH03_012670 [Edaphochlamys debaryana]|uniref:Transmembrane 9 superfamily member n=1 Tax=Edaphochlamys debaryana TaxID=47281 RepID=A0A836BTZ7_9CHLO|nr:hypothetical protein HYH03_012670 [Edaphochlamys debaryana]|eukprot:KAG2488875.1 hypothetical protein HYH03_012670 [Edaphochlamys debaryana]
MGVTMALALLLLALGAASVTDAERNRSYKQGDSVMLYANKIGPFLNPTEVYEFYQLPYCQPTGGKLYKKASLGEVLEGDRLVTTPFELKFRTDVKDAVLCNKTLSSADLMKFRDVVKQDYYFQMFYDDLPVWGFIGKVEKEWQTGTIKFYIFSHWDFDVSYNNDSIIDINVSPDPLRVVNVTTADQMDVQFSFTVRWRETSVPFSRRMDRYTRYSFLPQHLEIHWFGLMQAGVIVVMLASYFSTILTRVLKNECKRYSRDDELCNKPAEAGWKYLHGDVFRSPPQYNLFSAIMGVGAQVLAMVTCALALGSAGIFHPYDRGGLLTACVVLYALSAGIAGYVSGRHYKLFGGTNWVSNVVLCTCLSTGPLLVVFVFTDAVAASYGSTASLPLGTIGVLSLIWALVAVPLTVLGAFAAKRTQAELEAPCRTTETPRPVPPLPWYRTALPQMILAGVLPFWTIYIELYYVFASIWGHKVYTIYSVLAFIVATAVITAAFVTIALTHSQMMVEDHRWWWRSFLCGGSAGVFLYGYCFFYFFARSDMNGFMQTSFFFGYNAVVCYAFFLMLGSVGSFATHIFVRRMYRGSKDRDDLLCKEPLKEPLLGKQAEEGQALP